MRLSNLPQDSAVAFALQDPDVKELVGGNLIAKLRIAYKNPKKVTEWCVLSCGSASCTHAASAVCLTSVHVPMW